MKLVALILALALPATLTAQTAPAPPTYKPLTTLPRGQVDTINADETMVAGQVAERDMPLQPGREGVRSEGNPAIGQAEYAANGPDGKPLPFAEAKEVRLNARLDARIPMEMFTVDLKTGERTLAAFDNGDNTDHTPFDSPVRTTHQAHALAVVRAGDAATLRLVATAPGLKPATASITTPR